MRSRSTRGCTARRRAHPDRPYADPRVTVHIDDGRAFLERTDSQYDLILFALPDSLTLVAASPSLRLESYLFTREAMEEARGHLNPDGAFTMYNYYREQWLVDRLAGTLEGAYGHPPCVDSVGGGRLAVLTVGLPHTVDCPAEWIATARRGRSPQPTTIPFLYLQERASPASTCSPSPSSSSPRWRSRGGLGSDRPMRGYTDLFFMGAAFLLLETKASSSSRCCSGRPGS